MSSADLLSKEEIPNFDELLGVLSDKEVETLSKYFEKSEYVKGETIFYENEDSDVLYVIRDGEVEISKITNNETREYKPIVTLQEGNIFGEVSFLTETPRSAAAIAISHTVLFTVTRQDFNEILDKKPRIACKIYNAILQVLAYRLQRTDQQLINLAEEKGI